MTSSTARTPSARARRRRLRSDRLNQNRRSPFAAALGTRPTAAAPPARAWPRARTRVPRGSLSTGGGGAGSAAGGGGTAGGGGGGGAGGGGGGGGAGARGRRRRGGGWNTR